ncbi:membrane protein insertase YidC [Leeia sp.]|uniref:membrane protein insertase YidC n=1 Tax=Leeia sp. TaxID=2884678 RepID=UPI0035B28C00
MEPRRLLIFIVLSMALLLGWQQYQKYRYPEWAAQQNRPASAPAAEPAPAQAAGKPTVDEATLKTAGIITVNTDLIRAEIDLTGGDIRKLWVLKHGDTNKPKEPFLLLDNSVNPVGGRHLYVAQSAFSDESAKLGLPTRHTVYQAQTGIRMLDKGQDKLVVALTAPEQNGLAVTKLLTFHRNSYVIDVAFQIQNKGSSTVVPEAYYRILRDGIEPESKTRFSSAFTGAAIYTDQKKYQKVSFDDITKGLANPEKISHVTQCNNGWVAMVQHYFIAAWLPPAQAGYDKEDCSKGTQRQFVLGKTSNGLYSIGTQLKLPAVAAGKSLTYSMPLFVGPEEQEQLLKASPSLVVTKDYGIFAVVAEPLFWLLVKLHALVGNWGWAIIALTVLLKALFYYPSAASYRSMAKMRDLGPRLQRIKEQFPDDRQQQSRAQMELFKTEKVNPMGGCLPMLIQMPVFMGLYWVLLGAVELRQAPWLGWIQDLSQPDPYFILPVLMAISMWYQSTLNPAPTDPLQAKMMKIMPLMFSVFFFFSPSGLVVYWLVNNILTIIQQKVIYAQMGIKPTQPAKASSK